MRINCIFNGSKKCNSCRECDACDLTPGKKCNNCGRCLEMEGYDVKAIQIDQVLEEAGEYSENSNDAFDDDSVSDDLSHNHLDDEGESTEGEEVYLSGISEDESSESTDFKVVYIDDVEDIRGVIDGGEIISPSAKEAFPGLIIMNKK